jgi:hypothetical protein
MPRGVRNDEAAVIRGKIAVRDINRDALLALRHQSVEEQRIVDCALAASDLRVELERFFLVCIEQLGIV